MFQVGFSMKGSCIRNYIAITGSASLQDTHFLGKFGGTGNALKAGPSSSHGSTRPLGRVVCWTLWTQLVQSVVQHSPLPKHLAQVDPWLEPCVWCNPDPNRGLYSLSTTLIEAPLIMLIS